MSVQSGAELIDNEEQRYAITGYTSLCAILADSHTHTQPCPLSTILTYWGGGPRSLIFFSLVNYDFHIYFIYLFIFTLLPTYLEPLTC